MIVTPTWYVLASPIVFGSFAPPYKCIPESRDPVNQVIFGSWADLPLVSHQFRHIVCKSCGYAGLDDMHHYQLPAGAPAITYRTRIRWYFLQLFKRYLHPFLCGNSFKVYLHLQERLSHLGQSLSYTYASATCQKRNLRAALVALSFFLVMNYLSYVYRRNWWSSWLSLNFLNRYWPMIYGSCNCGISWKLLDLEQPHLLSSINLTGMYRYMTKVWPHLLKMAQLGISVPQLYVWLLNQTITKIYKKYS